MTQNPNPPVSCVASYNHGKRVLQSWVGQIRILEVGGGRMKEFYQCPFLRASANTPLMGCALQASCQSELWVA